jgi:adenylate kinase family enzyme
VAEHGFAHLSAGDLLRDEVASGSENGEMISNMMKAGALVPGEIPCRLIKAAMEKQGWAAKRFLIDGFPRGMDNYTSWQAVMGESIDLAGILHFVVDEEQLKQRILKRAETSGRADDNVETLLKRFATYRTEQLPAIK